MTCRAPNGCPNYPECYAAKECLHEPSDEQAPIKSRAFITFANGSTLELVGSDEIFKSDAEAFGFIDVDYSHVENYFTATTYKGDRHYRRQFRKAWQAHHNFPPRKARGWRRHVRHMGGSVV